MSAASNTVSWAAIVAAGLKAVTAENGRPIPPPTDTLPGTPEKVAVLCRRQRLHQHLWNPFGDPTFDLRNELYDKRGVVPGQYGTITLGISGDVARNGAVINRQTEAERDYHEIEESDDSIKDELFADFAARKGNS